jgi:hypothetical protein
MRGILGKYLIEDAISQFENISKKIQDGISHCQKDNVKHNEAISHANTKISENNIQIARAHRFLGNIKKLIGEPENETATR